MAGRITVLTDVVFPASAGLPRLALPQVAEQLSGTVTTLTTGVPTDQFAIAATADGATLLTAGASGVLSHYRAGQVAALANLGGGVFGLATDGRVAWACLPDAGRVARVDLSTGAVSDLATGLPGVTAVTPAADGLHLYAVQRAGRVQRINIGTGAVAQVADAVPAGASGVVHDAQRNCLYVSTQPFFNGGASHRIWEVSLADGAVTPLVGTGGQGYADGAGAQAQLNHPWHLALGGQARYLYVGEFFGHRVRRVDLGSSELTVATLAGSGQAGAQDGMGVAATLNGPLAVAFGGGALYVAHGSNQPAIRRVT